MTRAALSRSLALAATLVAGACSSTPDTLLESDIPVPPDMVVRYSTDIRREGSTLTGGDFLLAGSVEHLQKSVDTTVERFTSAGWKETSRQMQWALAVLEFSKGPRTCRVEIDARRVDPRMSKTVMRVAVATAPAKI